jgi:hypothetical protein
MGRIPDIDFCNQGILSGKLDKNKNDYHGRANGQRNLYCQRLRDVAVVLISPNVLKIPLAPARFCGFSANLLFVAKSVMQAGNNCRNNYVNVTYAKWNRTGIPVSIK